MNYKITNFREGNNPAADLEKQIEEQSSQGYEYVSHQYSDKIMPGSAGCFGFGAKPQTTAHIGFIVFKKVA